ncbi:MAG: hypothetical protein ABI723_24940 [Bacteroidia bacterium]
MKLKLFSIAALLGAALLSANSANAQWSLTGNAGTNASTNFIGTTDNVAFKVRTKNTVRVTVTGSGNVGIGTSTPAAKLDIAGTLKITDGSQGTGKVLQSDAAGKAHWAVPVASSSGTASTLVINTTNASAFTVPAGVYSLTIEAVAGSGGGGGSGSAYKPLFSGSGTSLSGFGGGGGGGEYGSAIVAVKPGDVIGITIGSAGVGGSGGAAINQNGTVGGIGGATIVSLNGVTVFTVNGGGGGQGSPFVNCSNCGGNGGSGGSGGSGSSVALAIAGTNGGSPTGGTTAIVVNGSSVIGGNGATGVFVTVNNVVVQGNPGTSGSKGQAAISYIPSSANGTIPFKPGSIIFAGAGGSLTSDLNFKWDSGKLGIGTTAPSNQLSVNGKADFSGYVGIGTTNPLSHLHVKGAGDQEISVESTDAGAHRWTIQSNGSSNASSFQIIDRTAVLSRLGIDNNGNVSIGTTTPATGYMLTVAGKIMCTELKVQLQPFPDYVFSKDYNLKSISEVEEHIKTFNRLPGMPGACEVEENGMSVGEMQGKVVEKVEELTLYIIQQQKQIDELKALINSQKK